MGINMNKFIIALLLWLSSGLLQAQMVEDDSIPEPPKEYSTYKPKPTNPYAHLDSLNYSRKAIYNIVFILPINKGSIRKGDGKEKPAVMSMSSREALGFWEGVNIAFGNIKNMNAKFNIHIWDNEQNDSVTQTILNEMRTMKWDAVVAPFHTSQALLVSKFCKEKKIPMFLAQNPSDIPAKDNPYVFKFHIPKNRLYYEYYVKIILDNSYRNTDVFFVYDGLNKADRKVANYLKYMSEKDGSKRLKLIEYSDDINLKNYFDSTRNATYLIGYYETDKVNDILAKVAKLKPYNVSVFGHNYWPNNAKLNKSLLDSLDARVYTDLYLQNNPSLLSDVKSKYTAMTKDRAITDVFLGYDVAMYVATVLNNYGVKFPLSIQEYKHYGSIMNINIRPIYDNNSNLLFFENDAKTLLRATDDGWIKEFIAE